MAQRHGASGGFSGHAGPSGGSFMGHAPTFSHGPSFSAAPHFGNNFASGHRAPFFSTPRRFNRAYRARSFYGTSPWLTYGYPGYYIYPYYDNYEYSLSDAYPGYDYSGGYDQSGQMEQDKIDRLEDEVAQLRQERISGRPSSQSKPEIRASTVLVFRDRHTQDVQNYAIVGETLWVFDAQRATKIPVDDLDVPATTKANDDRGVDFRLPDQP
jgi:hypothetical protein